MFQQLLPLITFLVGAGSTVFAETRRDARLLRRELAAHDRMRRAAAEDRRDTFELEHLLKLNSALSDHARAAGAAHHADIMMSRQTGKYGSARLGDELSDALMKANRSVNELKGLVLVDEVRQLVQDAQTALNTPQSARSEDAAEAAMATASVALNAAQSAIATRVRSIYLSGDEPR
ncbi:hypothetical protein ACTXG6_35220 [Pseudonocardia sp. Cha107L01]|uniref:hypothetical protein n=1 Tax=Pseudonocardia sp. Cha107L01 TaxID=3457576 RepID=UPI00403ED001